MLMQYGMRMRREAADMPFPEFMTLLAGIMPETPLGSVVAIRAEKDSKTIKNFSPDQKRIYNEWKRKEAQKQIEDVVKLDRDMAELEKALEAMFGAKGGG